MPRAAKVREEMASLRSAAARAAEHAATMEQAAVEARRGHEAESAQLKDLSATLGAQAHQVGGYGGRDWGGIARKRHKACSRARA
jgi:hypothetical protein